MLFNSYPFLLVFLPLAIGLYWLADRTPRLRMLTLIALSLAFYGYWDVRFLPLIILSSVLNWLLARYFLATGHKGIITFAIAANLAVLAVFKYANFVLGNLALAAHLPIAHVDIALPLGISFFTFHHIMYLVDLRRGIAPAVNLERYVLYICFFPQVLSGPLVRWSEVMHQFGSAMVRPGWQARCARGAAFIVLGLAQKVYLGDHLAAIVNPLFEQADVAALGKLQAAMATLGFTFQIFFDFSGYTDIAIGVALVFGIQLPLNFDGPYRAISIRDFWRKWHITLSRFLRDYLYIPLGGNRHGLPRQVAALLVTMGLGGLWHGAAWTFVAWGLLHGLALSIAHLWPKAWPIPRVFGWAITFVFVALTWIFFRAGTFAAAWHILESVVTGPLGPVTSGWRTIGAAAICAIALPPSHRLCDRLTARPNIWVAVGLAALAVATMIELGREQTYEFIYFRF